MTTDCKKDFNPFKTFEVMKEGEVITLGSVSYIIKNGNIKITRNKQFKKEKSEKIRSDINNLMKG